MEIDKKLVRADIVIIADTHNPSIISPQWLKEKGVTAEDALNFIHTPEFSLFEAPSFSLIVDRQRLQITTKKKDKEGLKALAKIAEMYVDKLPNIPYKALGLNFIWNISSTTNGSTVEIQISLNSIRDISSIFPEHELQYGCIIYAVKKPYTLRLTVEPKSKKSFIYNFNYHHELAGVNFEEIKRYINTYVELYEYSKQVIEKSLKRRR